MRPLAVLLLLAAASSAPTATAGLPGPYLVKDITPGGSSGIPDYCQLRVVGNMVVFAATDGTTGYELWKSDGTSQGTALLKDIRSGSISSDPYMEPLSGNPLYFSVTQPPYSYEQFWRTDGSAAGTVVAVSLPSGSVSESYPAPHFQVGNTLYFSAHTWGKGRELWKTSATGGTPEIVADIAPGSSGSTPLAGTELAGLYYFSAIQSTSGRELWRTDGTTGGTVLVKDIAAGTADSSPSKFTTAGGLLYFIANDGIHGKELWRSDGTTAGTFLVKDICPGIDDGLYINAYPYDSSLYSAGGLVYFSARTAPDSSHWSLWRSDGTAAGTFPLLAVNSIVSKIIPIGGNLVFVPVTDGGTYQVWKSDGSIAGTVPIKPGVKCQLNYAFPSGSGFYFGYSREGALWQSDGTPGGVYNVADFLTPISGTNGFPTLPVMAGERICLVARSQSTGYELWGYDTALPSVALPRHYDLTRTSARLELAVNPNGTATTAKLEYGPTTAYGTTVELPMTSSNADKLFHRFDLPLAGLNTGTTYHYKVSATSSKGTQAATGSFTAPATSQRDWRMGMFGTPENTGVAADDQDPDQDGIANVLEYAFGLNPFAPDAGNLPRASVSGGYLKCNFNQPPGIADIIYGAEWSSTLEPGSWATLNDGGSGDAHSFSLSAAYNSSMFMRLTATPR